MNSIHQNSVYGYQISQPNYLKAVFPRSVSGWHNFAKDKQETMQAWEAATLEKAGYIQQKDGSWKA